MLNPKNTSNVQKPEYPSDLDASEVNVSDVIGFDYQLDNWTIIDGEKEALELSFSSDKRFKGLTKNSINIVKAYIYSLCTEFEGTLVYQNKLNTLQGDLNSVTNLVKGLEGNFPSKQFSELDTTELLRLAVCNIDDDLRSHSSCVKHVTTVTRLHELQYKDTLINDYLLPSFAIDNDWERTAVCLFGNDINIAEWKAGGTLDTVPFEVSLAILTYSIELIRSTKTKYLLAFWDMVRDRKLSNNLTREKPITRLFENFGGQWHNLAVASQQLDDEYLLSLKNYFEDIETHSDLPLSEVPFNRSNVIDDTLHLRNACFTAMLILTGIRRSELQGMLHDGIKQDGKDFVYVTPIEKTNHGVPSERAIGSGLIEEIVFVMEHLGSVELGGEREFFFDIHTQYYSNNEGKFWGMGNDSSLKNQLDIFYQKFLSENHQDLAKICPAVTAHAFRHTWAEFAMRRFDGHVAPLIADHFRHYMGQFMNFTPAYTDGKITEDEIQNLGKRWIYDIVDRYITGADDLYGAMGKFLKDMVYRHKLIEIDDPAERKRFLAEISNKELGNRRYHFKADGVCCELIGSPEIANCRDANGVPKAEEATPDMCIGCRNHVQHNGHLEAHKRNVAVYALRAKAFSEEPVLRDLYADQANKEYRAMQVALDKMEDE